MVNSYTMSFTCAILAGGKSRRMGRDKATMPVGGRVLIARVYDEVKDVFEEVFIMSNRHKSIAGVDAPILKDIVPIQSPIVGIVSALLYSRNPYVFVLACDLPFISRQSIEFILSEAQGQDLIIPRTKGGYEPLYALYNKSCIPALFRLIERNRLKVTDVFSYLTMKVLPGEHPCFMNEGRSVFMNVNAVEDLAKLRIEGESFAIAEEADAWNREDGLPPVLEKGCRAGR
jgi:molybdopterin-guanine dinucleotide biosynthesis protein A